MLVDCKKEKSLLDNKEKDGDSESGGDSESVASETKPPEENATGIPYSVRAAQTKKQSVQQRSKTSSMSPDTSDTKYNVVIPETKDPELPLGSDKHLSGSSSNTKPGAATRGTRIRDSQEFAGNRNDIDTTAKAPETKEVVHAPEGAVIERKGW